MEKDSIYVPEAVLRYWRAENEDPDLPYKMLKAIQNLENIEGAIDYEDGGNNSVKNGIEQATGQGTYRHMRKASPTARNRAPESGQEIGRRNSSHNHKCG
ncbi:MAG: hypothetical protein WCY05_06580 [Candidatus Omnitrophota bacterium]